MSGELFKAKIGAQNMTHVPFRGSGEALPALLAGDVDFSFENRADRVPDDQVRATASTGCDHQRAVALPAGRTDRAVRWRRAGAV